MSQLTTSAVPSTYSFSNALAGGFDLYKRCFGRLMFLVAFFLPISLIFAMPSIWLQWSGGPKWVAIPVVFVLQAFVAAHLSVSATLVAVGLARGKPWEEISFFSGFKRYWTIVAIALIVEVARLLLDIPQMAIQSFAATPASEPTPVLDAFRPLAVFVLLPVQVLFGWIFVRLTIAQLVAADPAEPSRPVGDALRLGWGLTDGITGWSLYLLGAVLGLFMLVGLIALLLPAIFISLPLAFATVAVAYTQLRGQSASNPAPTDSAPVPPGLIAPEPTP